MPNFTRSPKFAPSVTRCAVYCRVSSAGQEDNSSLGTQEERCRAYADERDWAVVQVYREVHTGVELFERPQLTLLREVMRRGEFDVLLVYALDRLSRKQTHQGLVLSEAEHAGVRWDSVTEDIDDSPQGQILRAVIGGMAEMERLKIAERTTRGKMARIQSGKLLPGGKAPYGYRWRDATKGALDLDPDTAPVVQGIFEAIAAGGTLRTAVTDLRRRGVPTPTTRGTWHAQTIREMLMRHHYCGRAYAWGWKKRTKGNPQTFDPDKAISLPEGTAPAIVSEETWQAVQERLKLNILHATRSAKNPESALLRGGYVACGQCGRTVQARPRSNGKIEYLCAHGKRHGDCSGCSISGQWLDSATWERVEHILRNPEIVERELGRVRGTDPAAEDLATASRALAEVERQSANIARAIGRIDDDEGAAPLLAQLTELKQRRQHLNAEIERIEARREQWEQTQIRLDNLVEWTQTVGRNLEAMGWAERRFAMDALGVRVTVFPHGHEPRFLIDAELPLELASGTTNGTPGWRSFRSSGWRG
jgi:site-specific DNA recombinase